MTGITNQTLRTLRCVIAAFAIMLGPGGWSAAAQTTVTFVPGTDCLALGTCVNLGLYRGDFSWNSTFNGTSGGDVSAKSLQPVDPGSGSGGTTLVLPTFSASLISGVSPLSVQFRSTGPVGSNSGTIVNFGDGTIGNLNQAPICATCNPLGTVGHTYATAGTYTATLMDSYNTTLGTATVTVTSESTSSQQSAGDDLAHRGMVLPVVAGDRGLVPGPRIDARQVDAVACLLGENFKERALHAAVAVEEGMNGVQLR